MKIVTLLILDKEDVKDRLAQLGADVSEGLTADQLANLYSEWLEQMPADVDLVGVYVGGNQMNIVANDDVKGKRSVKMTEVPWDQAFLGILRTHGLTYDWEGDIIRVVTLEDKNRELEQLETEQKIKAKAREIELAEPLLTRIVEIDRGRLLALDTPDALRGLSRGTTLEVLAEPRRRAAEILAARQEVTDLETFGERLHVTLAGVPPAGAAAAAERIAAALRDAGLKVETSRPTFPSLEDIFIARIRDARAVPREVVS